MRNQRRGTLVVAFVAGMSLIAAACGDDDEGGAEPTAADTGGTDPGPPDTTTAGTDPDASTPPPSEDSGGPAPSGSITYAQAQEFASLNNNTADANSVANGLITTAVLPDLFPFAGPDGYPKQDEDLVVSAEVTQNPQVVTYVLNPDAVWSDGEPIDCDDLYLQWIAQNGKVAQLDENGEPVTDDAGTPDDPSDDATLMLFEPAGTTGFEQIESVECSADGKTITTTYSTPFADWQTLFQDMVPAHVVERQAGVDDLIAAYENDDRQALEALADSFANGFIPEPGTIPEDSFLSGDAYMIENWEPGQSLTLVANPAYWGTPPASERVVVRYVAEEAQPQAIANGEVNTADPQPAVDLIAQLENIDGVTVENFEQFTWEHFTFNFRNDALKNFDVRQAFAKCVPRQQILENLIKPVSPDATLLNNRWIQEFEPAYEDHSRGLYDTQDLDGARTLLEDPGFELPIQLRLGWRDDGNNQRRADQVALTIEACNQVGFEIVDAGLPDFYEGPLDDGELWDVAMFAWAGSPSKLGSLSNYATGGGNNEGRYSNPDVDALVDKLSSEPDADRVLELANEIDAILWEDLATIPLFSHPGIVAYDDTVDGVVGNPSQNGLTFNAKDWKLI